VKRLEVFSVRGTEPGAGEGQLHLFEKGFSGGGKEEKTTGAKTRLERREQLP